MADSTDALLNLYQEERNQGRQSETQRSTIANFIITISAVVLGFLVQKGFTPESLPLAILLIGLGVYGAVISAKLYERWQYHMRRARRWRKRVDELNPDAKIEICKKKAKKEQKKKHPILWKVRLHWLWSALHISIALSGVICVIVIILHKS